MFYQKNGTTDLVMMLLATIGAINWGVVSLFNANLLIDVLGMAEGSQQIMIAYFVIGAAGAMKFVDVVGESEVLS